MHDYDANGAESAFSYPDGTSIAYQPNALGQPTKAGSYATGVKYYPNGAMASFTYGNNLKHSLDQNARQFPERSRDLSGASALVDLQYVYDGNGNVTGITDATQGGTDTRTMGDDALDRLTSANAPSLWGVGTFGYDALDNLTSSTVGTRTYTHTINATTQRLEQLSGGGTTIAYGYDTRGNVTSRGTQGFTFDAADRLTRANGVEEYAYDGLGRRVSLKRMDSGMVRYQAYGKNGALLYAKDMATQTATNYVHLNGSLVARVASSPVPVPSAPTVTAPSSNTTGSFTISWSAPAGAINYVVQETPDAGASWRDVYTGSGTSLPLTRHGNGIWQFHAKACNGSGCSVYGAAATTVVSNVTTPPAPAGLVATPNPSATGAYELAWPASAGASDYRLEENANGTGWGVSALYAGAATTLPVSGRSDGSYRYRVAACNANACSPPGAPITVTVLHASVPGVPTLTLPPTSSTGNYTASWNAISGATRYELVERGPGAWQWTTFPTSATSYALTGRGNGTWQYRLRSCNTSACGDFGPVVSVAVTLAGAPPPPASFTISPNPSTTGNATLSWTAPASGTVTRYQLDRSVNGGGWVSRYAQSGLGIAESNLANGSYAYRLAACNVNLCSTYRTGTLTVDRPIDPPPRVTNLHVTPTVSTDGTYVLSWNASSGATKYMIDESLDGGAWSEAVAIVTTTSKTFTDRNNGHYLYKVVACNDDARPACSSRSNALTAAVDVLRPGGIDAPAHIYGVTGCSGGGGGRTYTIGWDRVAAATRYQLREDNDANTVVTPIEIPTNTITTTLTRRVVGGANPTTYSYQVRACSGASANECSAWRGTATACVGNGTLLAATSQTTTTYLHTDALHSPIAESNEQGQITTRLRYEPYGAPTNGLYTQGPGYTGHVMDAATQLVYMQQRYYDPMAGRFLSTDPVGGSFNRYWYANNNPYRNIDPDGRECAGTHIEGRCESSGGSGVAGVTTFSGTQMHDAGAARAGYSAAVSKLDASDSAGRSALKTETRAATPSVVRSVVGAVRPSVDAVAGSGGTANASSAAFDGAGKALRAVGGVAVVATVAVQAYDVAHSPEPTRALAGAGGTTLGGLAGGEAGAYFGAQIGAVGGPIGIATGAVIGGLIGSIGGGYVGGQATTDVYDYSRGN